MAKEELMETVEVCENACHHHHPHNLEILSKEMPSDEQLYDLAELFKMFGDFTRVRILFALLESEVCVCDLADALDMTQSAVSHQLSLLKKAKLIVGRRDGKSVMYSLADEHVKSIVAQGMEHVLE